MSHPASRRDGFTSSFGVLAATLGSAVGLGNIWKFPYLTGANGGASFLVVYLLATLIVGLPVMMAEIMLGRAARANAVSTFEKLTPGKRRPWWLVGLAGALAAFLVLAFYSEVAGWVFAYVFKSLTNQVLTSDPNVAGRVFESMITDPWQALLWQWAVLAFIGAIILMGVSKGIEAVTKRLMPVLFILLLVICVRSLTRPRTKNSWPVGCTPNCSRSLRSLTSVSGPLSTHTLAPATVSWISRRHL